VNKMALSIPPRRRGVSVRRIRRTTRFALACESLESRQLLSLGNSGLVAAGIPPLSTAQAQFAAPPIFSSFGNTGFSPGQFGTFAAQNQSPIIVIVVGVLPFSFNGGSNFAPTSSTGLGGNGSAIGTLAGNSGNSGNNNSGNTLTSGPVSTSVPSITPLNPNLASSTNTPGGPPVQLIPPPLPPLVVHLTASTAPATNQSNSTFLSVADEQPPAITHFGQGAESEMRRVIAERIERETMSNSLIDFVAPYRVIDPAPPQAVDPAQPGVGEKAPAADPAPTPASVRPLPPISNPDIDAALDMTDARILTRSGDHAASRSDEQVDNGNTHWSLSALFGAAAVATGGYHLVLRESDRVRGRSIPRWVGAERPTKRKTGVPSR
jgi:hypothetical protein